MHLVQVVMLIVVLSCVMIELLKIPKELLRLMEIGIFQKRKNLAEFGDSARFTLKSSFRTHKKAC